MGERMENVKGGALTGGAFGVCVDAIFGTPGLFTAGGATLGGIVGFIKKSA